MAGRVAPPGSRHDASRLVHERFAGRPRSVVDEVRDLALRDPERPRRIALCLEAAPRHVADAAHLEDGRSAGGYAPRNRRGVRAAEGDRLSSAPRRQRRWWRRRPRSRTRARDDCRRTRARRRRPRDTLERADRRWRREPERGQQAVRLLRPQRARRETAVAQRVDHGRVGLRREPPLGVLPPRVDGVEARRVARQGRVRRGAAAPVGVLERPRRDLEVGLERGRVAPFEDLRERSEGRVVQFFPRDALELVRGVLFFVFVVFLVFLLVVVLFFCVVRW